MSLRTLPPEWRDWVRENVARGCVAETMLPMLVEGGFAPALAQAALDEAFSGRALPEPAPVPRPGPRLDDGNMLDAGDRRVRVLSVLESPCVVHFGGLLSGDECDALVSLAEGRMEPSIVVDDHAGAFVPHADRTSAGACFQRSEFPLVATLEQRIAALLHWPVSHGEGLQVLRYALGAEYKAHFDFFDPDKPGSAVHLAEGGQRVGTLVMYLGDVEAGGGTRFPRLGFEVRPAKGDAVFFTDVDPQGRVDPRTLHAGLPVVRGHKVIATKWLRQHVHGS